MTWPFALSNLRHQSSPSESWKLIQPTFYEDSSVNCRCTDSRDNTMSLSLDGFYWVFSFLPGFTRFYWLLLNLTRFYQVLLGFTEFFLVY